MDKKKRSFKDFLQSSGIDEVKKVTIEYAIENDTLTLAYLADKYNLSISAVKKLIAYAIVNCLVSYKVALFIKGKAHRNQVRHCRYDVAQTSSDIYYNEIFNRRFNYVKTFDDETVLIVVNFYLENPHLSGSAIAESLGLSTKEMNILLKKAIIFGIVDDETVSALQKVSLDKVDYSAESFINSLFVQYKQLRSFYKFLNEKIVQLHFQLETYDNFVSIDNDMELSKDTLEEELENAKNSLQKFIDSF